MHISVMVKEAVEWLAIRPEGIYVDATAGAGGHSRAILEHLTTGRLLALDRDPQAIELARRNLLAHSAKLTLVQQDFAGLAVLLAQPPWTAVDGILADLGVSQMQIDTPERGFSFRAAGPLDMRMDPSQRLTAEEIVNHWGERELADAIYRFGEERRSRRIAGAIVRARPIRNTEQLAKLITEACQGSRRDFPSHKKRLGGSQRAVARTPKRIHPATLTFQALRIVVNSELDSLTQLLNAAPGCLKPGGRLVIISFHSLEDRIVKQQFQQWDRAGVMRNLTRHVVRPADQEALANPRSRSARLRAAERLGPVSRSAPTQLPESAALRRPLP